MLEGCRLQTHREPVSNSNYCFFNRGNDLHPLALPKATVIRATTPPPVIAMNCIYDLSVLPPTVYVSKLIDLDFVFLKPCLIAAQVSLKFDT